MARAPLAPKPTPTPKGHARSGDRLFAGTTAAFAGGIVILLGLMLFEMLKSSLPSLQAFGLRFLTGTTWDPVMEEFGALPFLYGTVVTSLLALLIGGGLGLAVAIYVSELAPDWIRTPISFLVELLAAIPSVIYGLWGIFVMVPFLRSTVEPWLGEHLGFLPIFQGPSYGIGLLAGGLLLAIMIIPTISSISREVLASVPTSQKEALLALGATRWEVISRAILPYARSGLFGAAVLGLGRALGETMAVTMVIGNRPDISLSLFSPAYTMASIIANEFSEATSNLYLAALIEVGLVLFAVTLVLNGVARLLVWRVGRQGGRSS